MRDLGKLRLRREAMTDLRPDDLLRVAAGDSPSGIALCEYTKEIVRQSTLPTCWCTQTCA